MDRHDLLLQRYRDGRLGRDEAAALERMVAADPGLAARAQGLSELDGGLRQLAARQGDDHHLLAERITAALPPGRPRAEARISLRDLVFACMTAGVVAMTYVVIATITNQVQLLVALALVSLVAGCVVMLLAGSLRRAEADVLGRLLGKRISVGPGDVLIYRAVGLSLAVGGVWLARSLA
jgi:anti-sigma factor RsiW